MEYDPNRTAFIALVKYDDGEQAYILAPQRLAVGDKVIAGNKADVKPGNAMPLQRHADRYDRPQRRDEAGQGRPDRPFGWHLSPSSSAVTGGYAQILPVARANCAWSIGECMAHRRRRVEPGPLEHQPRQGRP